MDKASDSNRVMRFSVVGNPSEWGLYCYEQGQELIVLNPHLLFTLEFECYIQVVEPQKNIVFLEKGDPYAQRVQTMLDSVMVSCVNLKNMANTLYQERQNWAAINLYCFALGRPDKTLDDNLKMILHGNTAQAYNSLNDARHSKASLQHIEEAIQLCHKNGVQKQHL